MNHLPECGYTPEQLGFGGINSGIDSTQPFISGHPCICEQLNACEQRVLDAAREAVAEQKLVPLAKQGRFIITRNTKLWKQRQAWSELGWWDFRTSALAAMDALREKP